MTEDIDEHERRDQGGGGWFERSFLSPRSQRSCRDEGLLGLLKKGNPDCSESCSLRTREVPRPSNIFGVAGGRSGREGGR